MCRSCRSFVDSNNCDCENIFCSFPKTFRQGKPNQLLSITLCICIYIYILFAVGDIHEPTNQEPPAADADGVDEGAEASGRTS